jgi:hypothetical protein
MNPKDKMGFCKHIPSSVNSRYGHGVNWLAQRYIIITWNAYKQGLGMLEIVPSRFGIFHRAVSMCGHDSGGLRVEVRSAAQLTFQKACGQYDLYLWAWIQTKVSRWG